MPLVSMVQLLADARRRGYAVCYCESWNLESFQAVVEAAEETRSSIIAGFNGGFLRHAARRKPANLAYYAGMALALRSASVPITFLLNETDSLSQIDQAIELGFNAVMVENDHMGLVEYKQLVKAVVELAHQQGVSVEAQIGRLPDGAGHTAAEVTDPELARAFVEETGIDALSVAVGNVHILTKGKTSLDLRALEQVRKLVDIPLVLHGGTGIPLEAADACIQLGIAKVNFGTILKQRYLEAIREKLGAYRAPMSPHPFLGMGSKEDILVGGLEAVKHTVKELLNAYGSVAKADAILGRQQGQNGNSNIEGQQHDDRAAI